MQRRPVAQSAVRVPSGSALIGRLRCEIPPESPFSAHAREIEALLGVWQDYPSIDSRRRWRAMGPEHFAALMFWAVVGIFAIVILSATFFTVEQQSRAIIERFGRYVRTANPGLNVKIP